VQDFMRQPNPRDGGLPFQDRFKLIAWLSVLGFRKIRQRRRAVDEVADVWYFSPPTGASTMTATEVNITGGVVVD
jgi:hypothetical protein